ncbi:MAG: hypothetical protein JSS02_24295 [Planctomycetes bacterium]|nr:hypothetical protein [Planctomycetota bacterium]
MAPFDASNTIPPAGASEPAPSPVPPVGGSWFRPAAPRTNWKAVFKWIVDQLRWLLPWLWRKFCDAVRYYWGIRKALAELICGFAPSLLIPDSVRAREARLDPYESHPMAQFGPDGWKFAVPGCCVVCGQPSQRPTTDETLAVDDASRAFWTPALVIVAGLTVGWFLFGRIFATICIPLGFELGYILRTRVPVRMSLVRCDLHVRQTNIPQVLAWGDLLVVRFGHKSVRKAFRYAGSPDPIVPAPVPTPVESPVPESVPLADSPHPETAVIRHSTPPQFTDDEQPPVF